MRVLPPEAYTNRELAQAYSWLMNQPEHIQRLGTTKEAVISLFKRAQRGGDLKNTETQPVNSEAFQADLRSLADGLKTFESHPNPPRPHFSQPSTTSGIEFDERSWKMIQTVKSELNLSHELEAVRLLIKLGFEKVSVILPSNTI